MAEGALRGRRSRELVLIALLLTPFYPVGAVLAHQALSGWGRMWLTYSPVLLLTAWVMAVAVLVGEKPRRGRSERSTALYAATVGAVVVLGLPFGVLLVAAFAQTVGG